MPPHADMEMMTSTDPSVQQLQEENQQLRRQMVDLTAAVDRLKETSDMYRIVADTAADAIICMDENSEIIYANPSVQSLLGHSPASLIGQPVTILIPAELQRPHQAAFRRFIETGEKTMDWTGVELSILHADGTEIPVEVSFGAVHGQQGRYHFSGFIRDARPRKRLEKESRERLSALAHANRLKSVGELASGIAHELNQPLSAVCLHADYALELLQDDNHPLRENLEITAAQAERAAEIIRLLRDMIRKNEPRREPFPLNRAIHAVVRLMQAEFASRSIRLRLELSEDNPFVHADCTQIEQIMLNLLQNAMEAIDLTESECRQIHVASGITRNGVQLQVSDSGPGIPEEKLRNVFENFYSTKQEGIGIGLGICKSIAEMHRGRIQAENMPEGGARFTLLLPVENSVEER